MVPFLKGFLSNLTAVQSKQILRILSQMRDKGEIRSAADFENKLIELSALVSSDKLTQQTPLLTFEEGELLESDAIRTFIEKALLDLEAALGESERLSNSMRSHNRILSENYFDSIEAAVSELEAETRAYEVLETRKFTGFNSEVKRFSFSGAVSTPGASKSDGFSDPLFVDGRGGEKLYYSSPKVGDLGLGLAITNGSQRVINFDKVEIFTDSTTPQTALSTSTEINSPGRAIDGSLDTSWKHYVLLSDVVDTCRLIFVPSFVGARRVNILSIHPLSNIRMKIVSLSYIDSGGDEVNIPIGTSHAGVASTKTVFSRPLGEQNQTVEDWILPNKTKFIDVGDIVARKFIITLQQDSGTLADFFYDDTDLGHWSHSTQVTNYRPVLSKSGGLEISVELGFVGNEEEGRRQAHFQEFVFGFKEVETKSFSFLPNGYFVPETVDMSNPPSVLALYTDAEFPRGERTDIEFLLLKGNYDSAGNLMDTETIPILPYGQRSVDERLFLLESHNSTTADNVGLLRFYPDFSTTFSVYKEDTELTIGSDYNFSVDGGTTWETSLPPSSTPDDLATCLVRVSSPQTGVFYSVTYTPLVSTSDAGGEVWLNITRTVRLGRDNTYIFDNQRPNGSISSCKLGLQIITRTSTLNDRVSPYLKEAILLGG